jgi:hypothetical protein
VPVYEFADLAFGPLPADVRYSPRVASPVFGMGLLEAVTDDALLALVFVSLAPVLAGLLVSISGRATFEPLVACLIAVWLVASTLREVVASHEELLWPDWAERGFRGPG